MTLIIFDEAYKYYEALHYAASRHLLLLRTLIIYYAIFILLCNKSIYRSIALTLVTDVVSCARKVTGNKHGN